MKNGHIIPIIFASNDAYAPYLGIAIQSLIAHVNSQYEYRISILSSGISEDHQWRISELGRHHACISIEFLDVASLISNYHIQTVNHLTQETALRLLIDRMFPQYDKVLYLDCDIIINNDVAELYHTDIGDFYIGASYSRLCIGTAQYIRNNIDTELFQYFNAGILLMNLQQFRHHHIGEKCLKMLQEGKTKYATMDQDVLNIVCKGHVYFIDGRWNVEWENIAGDGIPVIIDNNRLDSLQFLQNPYIVHYTSPYKPWKHSANFMSDYFWKYAKNSVFYEEILIRNMTLPPQNESVDFEFPWEFVKYGEKIIIYGMGNVGKIFVSQVKKSGFCNLLAISDRNKHVGENCDFPYVAPEKLISLNFDRLIIAVADEKISLGIKQSLLELGIPEGKILWKKQMGDN